jgi:acetyl-CoA carboxylase biotin carboxyl carrier protein
MAAKPRVDTELIEQLAELLQRTGLTEIEVAEGEARIRVARAIPPVAAQVAAGPPATPTAAAGPTPELETAGALRAPMVGTAYLAPEPGAKPFVALGDMVEEGQTLLIIEAMKVMNPIRATRAGRVTQLLVNNGDPVEFGELLLVIE